MNAKTFLSKVEIGEITEKLEQQHDPVTLDCDGYLVTATLMRITKLKLGIRVYVNGWMRSEWLDPKRDHEEGRRFYRLAIKRLATAGDLKLFASVYGKRSKKYREAAARTFSFRASHWTSATSMLRHFRANNASVRLLDAEEAKLRIDALDVERTAAQEVAAAAKAGAE